MGANGMANPWAQLLVLLIDGRGLQTATAWAASVPLEVVDRGGSGGASVRTPAPTGDGPSR